MDEIKEGFRKEASKYHSRKEFYDASPDAYIFMNKMYRDTLDEIFPRVWQKGYTKPLEPEQAKEEEINDFDVRQKIKNLFLIREALKDENISHNSKKALHYFFLQSIPAVKEMPKLKHISSVFGDNKTSEDNGYELIEEFESRIDEDEKNWSKVKIIFKYAGYNGDELDINVHREGRKMGSRYSDEFSPWYSFTVEENGDLKYISGCIF